MKSQAQSSIEKVEIHPESNAEHAIIWLHGLGADGHDFVPIVPELGLPSSLAIRFIFPHAPIMPITINSGYEMRAWFDIHDLSLAAKIDEAGITASRKLLEELIAEQVTQGIAPENIILAGFSQGGAIALTTGLNYPKRLGGIIALSTFLPLAENVLPAGNDANKDIPIFLAHGTNDNVLPFVLGDMTKQALEQFHYSVEWHSYPMPHSVCPEEIVDIGEWIKKVWG